MWDDRSTEDGVIFGKEDRSQEIKMRPVEFPQDTELAGRVVGSDAAALDLVELALGADRIGSFGGFRRHVPAERSAEQILRQIPDGVVGASNHAAPTKLVGSPRMKAQQFRGGKGFER